MDQITSGLADKMAEDLTPSLEEPIDEGATLRAQERAAAFEKITFTWKAEDQAVLARVRAAAEQKFAEVFSDAVAIIDDFYGSLRVPEVNRQTGMVLRDEKGRPVWQRNAVGKYVENWDQLTGQDIEKTLMDLQRLKMEIAPEVNWLLNEALYAKHIADDSRDEAWAKVLQGTQGDRQAKANRVSRPDRYHAFFRYILWSQGNVFLNEINAFCARLKDIRYWRIQEQK
jgi:hypothetical protein